MIQLFLDIKEKSVRHISPLFFAAKILVYSSFPYEVNFSHFELIWKEWLLSAIYAPQMHEKTEELSV